MLSHVVSPGPVLQDLSFRCCPDGFLPRNMIATEIQLAAWKGEKMSRFIERFNRQALNSSQRNICLVVKASNLIVGSRSKESSALELFVESPDMPDGVGLSENESTKIAKLVFRQVFNEEGLHLVVCDQKAAVAFQRLGLSKLLLKSVISILQPEKVTFGNITTKGRAYIERLSAGGLLLSETMNLPREATFSVGEKK